MAEDTCIIHVEESICIVQIRERLGLGTLGLGLPRRHDVAFLRQDAKGAKTQRRHYERRKGSFLL